MAIQQSGSGESVPPVRAASPLSWLPEPVRYALHPFLVHGGIDRLWLPRNPEVLVEGIDGARFALDLRDEIAREILNFGAYEKRNIEIMRRLTRGRPGSFLDVGANLGGHTVLLARQFTRTAAFEPNPASFERLSRNLALNGISGSAAQPFGLSDTDADLPFQQVEGSNPGKSGFVDAERPDTLSLPVRNGDGVVETLALAPVSAIKIDVEGHEERVLAGLSRTVQRDRPAVFFEWEAARNGAGCFERLPGYRFLAQPWELTSSRLARPFARGIDAARPPRLTPVTPETLAGRYVSMVVALPKEHCEAMLQNLSAATSA